MLAVTEAVGVVAQTNVSVPFPCAEQYISAVVYTALLSGANVTNTLLLAVTPVTLFVHVLLLQSDTAIVTVVDVIGLQFESLKLYV